MLITHHLGWDRFRNLILFLLVIQFDIPRTRFDLHGEFLSLTVEGLSENRPSLLVGDSVIATTPGAVGDSGTFTYEGIIHEVLHSKVSQTWCMWDVPIDWHWLFFLIVGISMFRTTDSSLP